MERRNTVRYNRKLFSVYSYKKVTRSASHAEKENDGSEKDLTSLERNITKDEKINSVLNSCTHYYKRDLTPIRENFQYLNPRTPYR
jgi:hypothetical protein